MSEDKLADTYPPRFTEIPSFMRAPIAQDLNDLDIALIAHSRGSGTSDYLLI